MPGDRLDLRITMTRMSARAGKGDGEASVGGEVACTCSLMFVVVDAADT